MEQFKHQDGNGSIFKNENKTPENNQPDYRGSIVLQDGVEQQIAGWIKKGNKGSYLSLKLSDPYIKDETPVLTPPSHPVLENDGGDDLPF